MAKLEYDLRQVDAWSDGVDGGWYWNESIHLDSVMVDENADSKRAFLRALKKFGVVCKRGTCVVRSYDGSVWKLLQRKDDMPLFAFVPMF